MLLHTYSAPKHRRFQTRASPGIARVKFWSIVLIAYHYIVLRDDETESSDSKDNRQSKARRLGGGTGFFCTHKPTVRAARVACLGNLAALKQPLLQSKRAKLLKFFKLHSKALLFFYLHI